MSDRKRTRISAHLLTKEHVVCGYGRVKDVATDEGKGDLAYVHVCTPTTCLLYSYGAQVEVYV